MISLCLSAFLAPAVLHSNTVVYKPRCIQPEFTIVHKQTRLVDIVMPNQGDVIERSTQAPSVSAPIDGSQSRLMLDMDEQIRIRSTDGRATKWTDPFKQHALEPEAEQTPAWALGAVWYNIFPERFDNAEPRNDQGWPHGTPTGWQNNWFTVTPDEFEASANRAIASPSRYRDDHERDRQPLHDVVFERRFGGDIQGIQRRLDHVESLGATAIWLCPVFDAVSLHKYDATDHRHIDPNLGWPGKVPPNARQEFTQDHNHWDWTPADLAFVGGLIPAVHKRQMKLIIDGVWNHVGTAHPAFQNALEQGAASPYSGWFDLHYDGSGRVTAWRAWDRRNGNLPAFSQRKGDLVAGPKRHVFDVTSRWMDPNGDGDPSDGIDGWRLDVANEVGMAFWKDWRNHVRSINPDAVLFGELWFDGEDYFGGKAFDAQMNYPVAFALLPWLSGEPNAEIAEDLTKALDHHPATVLTQMNLLASHDTARLVSLLANPGLGYDQGAGLGASDFDRSKPNPESYDRLELAYAVLTALPGSPMVFAGDELGMWGADDPENRKPLPWPDLMGDPRSAELALRTTDRISRWLLLRSDPTVGEVLRYGGWRLSTVQDILVIERDLNGQRVRLYANPLRLRKETDIGPVEPCSARLVVLNESGDWVDIHGPSEKPG